MIVMKRIQALLDGKKLRFHNWETDEYCFLEDGFLQLSLANTEINNIALFEECDGWEIYEEPKPEIKLTPEHVGKKVRLRDGDVALIIEYDARLDYFSMGKYKETFSNGRVFKDKISENDVIEILD